MDKNPNIKKISLKESLGFTLLTWFLFIAIVPTAIISYKSYVNSAANLKKAAIHELMQSSSLNHSFIKNWFEYRKIDISSWSQSKANANFLKLLSEAYTSSDKDLEKFIKSFDYNKILSDREADILTLSREYDYIYDILMIDTKGNILYSVAKESDLGKNLLSTPYSSTTFAMSYVKTLQDGGIHFSDLQRYEPSNYEIAGFLTAPLVDENGDIIGVFAVQLKLNRILSLFEEPENIRKGFSHYLVGLDGLLRSDIFGKQKVLDFNVTSSQFLLWYNEHGPQGDKLNNQKEIILSYKDPFDEDVMGIHQDINILGVKWVLISEVTQKSVLNATTEIAKVNIIFLIMTIVIVIIVALLITRRITKPLQLLANASIDFSRGKRNISVDVRSKGEIAQLASSFNIMTQALNVNEIKLTNQTNQANKALEELDEQKFALNAHSIVAITNVKGKITFVNDKFVEISGFSREELIGKNHRLLNSGVHGTEFWKNMYKTISNGRIWNGEVCNLAKSGNPYWVSTTIVPFMDANNKPRSYIAIRTDVTEQKEIEEELIKSTKIAEESVKAKAEFLASMSHEIRTPMNGVIGMLGLLLHTKLDETQKHQAHLAQSSANALLTLINDILDFSKVEAGKLELENIDFNLRDELGDFAHSIAFRAEAKGVALVLDVVDVEHAMISADSGRIRQILNNIVGNSIKFTSQGHILIKVRLYVSNHQKTRLKIDISDTGIGIPEEKIAGLFDSFTQVDASTTRKYGGTGLGLAIVKKLTALMDGGVVVTSELGVGTTFSVDIAVNMAEVSSLVMPKDSVDGMSVLIVDNSAINVEVLKRQLEYWGMRVESASNEVEALELPPFDIAFIDMNAKSLGLKFSQDTKYETMKLVMMSSMSSRGDAKELHDLGFDTFFLKPAATKDLFKSLNILFENSELDVEEDEELEEDVIWPQNIRLLLVEDNRTNQLVANGILDTFGLNADVANDGVEALKAIQDSSDSQPYSLVFMDCQMPEMDGYEASAAIREGKAGEKNTKLPIIAMTANAMQGDKQKCIAAGMDDYISKPINPSALKNMLKKWILNAESEIVINVSKESKELVVWDKKEALSRLGGSKELLVKIIEVFLEDIITHTQQLQEAIDEEDTQKIKLYSHTIKGSAANLSATKLQSIAKSIELNFTHDYTSLQNATDELMEVFKEYVQNNSNDTTKKKTMEVDEILSGVESLKHELNNGEFIDSQSLEIFNVNFNDTIDEKLKHLKKEVDNFETDKALVLIDEIILELQGDD